MQKSKYIYFFGYDNIESELCKLESKYIFNKQEKDRLLFSDLKVEPSSSAFIKKRLQVVASSSDYGTLIKKIKKENICIEDFKVEYLVFEGDKTEYAERLSKLKDVGFSIEGIPDYYNPTVTYALCCYEGIWYFAVITKDNFDWYRHKEKPCSYSNSISISIAKALVNIAAKADRDKKLLDACCGVGTIMLEACFAGYLIEGCDINWKICRDARENISYFNYKAEVFLSDIKDLRKKYDAAIIDLPYNLLSSASDSDILHILASSAQITDRLIIVSTADISKLINNIGFRVIDHCSVSKNGKTSFARRIWVCEKKA